MARRKKLKCLDDDAIHAVDIERRDEGFRVSGLDPSWSAMVTKSPGSGIWSILTEDGSSFEALVSREDGELRVDVGHRTFRFAPEGGSERRRAGNRVSGRQEIRAPMPGKVVEVLVAEGDVVTAGQPVLLFEAMKMQNELRSPHDGVVVEVVVSAGQAVEAREPLYSLESAQH
jgi:biotin carboxyl carrier protein